ncbi:flagellar FlbD family protein [Leifsonia sp. YAF41]|uniref:flagellar FlbD family protein n=1 Tax=Leifsonia sp. YAF41 TaxID=3233086 RepID=UPI003F9D14BB
MIVVTRLNNSHFAVNPDLIERIHENPDTTLVLVDGSTYIVTESMSEVIDKIARYRARVIALASQAPEPSNTGIRHLEAVPADEPREPRRS